MRGLDTLYQEKQFLRLEEMELQKQGERLSKLKPTLPKGFS